MQDPGKGVPVRDGRLQDGAVDDRPLEVYQLGIERGPRPVRVWAVEVVQHVLAAARVTHQHHLGTGMGAVQAILGGLVALDVA